MSENWTIEEGATRFSRTFMQGNYDTLAGAMVAFGREVATECAKIAKSQNVSPLRNPEAEAIRRRFGLGGKT